MRLVFTQNVITTQSTKLTIHQRNIVIDNDSDALLIGFKLARIKHEVTRSKSDIIASGSYRYLAPELVVALSTAPGTKFRTSPASDCYAFGMTLLALVTLQHPFSEYGYDFQALGAAEQGIWPARPDNLGGLPPSASDARWALLNQMWSFNPDDRPSLDMVGTTLEGIISMILQA